MSGALRAIGKNRIYKPEEEESERKRKGLASIGKSKESKEKNDGGFIEGTGYVAGSLGLGLAGVVEGMSDIVQAAESLAVGDADMAKYYFLDNKTAQAQQNLTEWYNPGKGMKFAGDVASGIGNSLTFMIPYVGPYLAAAGYLGMGISGAAEKTGDVGLKEIGYGAANAGMEFVMDKFVGGAGQAGKSIMSSLTRKGAATAGKVTAKMAGKGATAYMLREIGKGALGEFAEEASTEAVDPLLQRLFGIDKNASTTIRDVAYAGLVGALSGGLMTAGPAAINFESARKTGKEIREGGEVEQVLHTAEILIKGSERAQTKAKETKASEKADKAASTADKIKGAATGVVGGIKRGRAASAAGEMADKLRRNVTAYRQMMADPARATTDAADALLGELRGNMYLAQVAYQMETYEAVLMNAKPEQKQQIVDVINAEAAKRGAKRSDYTVADLENNVDDILTSTAGRAVLESMMQEMAGETTEAPQTTQEAAGAMEAVQAEEVATGEKNTAEIEEQGLETDPWEPVKGVEGFGTQNQQEADLLKAAVTNGVPKETIPAMLNSFREGTDMTPSQFANAWADGVMFFGRYGLNEATISEDSDLYRMSENARRASIREGKIIADEETRRAQEKAEKKKIPARNKADAKRKQESGGKIIKGKGLIVNDLTPEQYAAYKAAEALAHVLGTDIEIETSLADTAGKQTNGYYDDATNKLHININAKRDGKSIALYTLGHEVAHYIKEWSPAKFRALSDFVMEHLGKDAEGLIAAKVELLRKIPDYKDYTVAQLNDLAAEEVVADGIELVLADGKIVDELARTDESIWKRMKDFIKKVISDIKKYFSGLNQASKTAQVLRGTVESLDEIEQLFYEGVVEAGERTRTAETVTGMNEENMQVTVKYKTADDNNESSIKEQIKKHASQLESMTAVDKVAYSPMNKKKLHEKVSEKFKTIGYKVERQNFGTIEIGEKQIDKSINYINSEGEKAALFAIPAVLKRGIVVDGHDNHKGREYNTVTIAAPIEVNGTRGIVGAVVTKIDGKNKYRVHRILTPDGSEFVFDVKRKDAEPTSGEPLSSDKRAPIGSASKRSISQDPDSVNRKYSISEENSSDTRYSIDETPKNADVSGNAFDKDGKIEAYRKAFEEQGIKTILDAEKRAKAAERSAERAAERSATAIYKAKRDAREYKNAVYRTAYAKADEKNRAYRETMDRKAEESRERKEMTARKRTIMRVLGALQTKLNHPTKSNHAPKELHDLVEKFMKTADPKAWDANRKNIREMGDLAADIEKLERKPTRTAKEQTRLDAMKSKYEILEKQTMPLKQQAEALYAAYKQFNDSLPEGVRKSEDDMRGLSQRLDEIENKPLKEMGLESLKAAEEFVKALSTQINNANELFTKKRGEQVSDWGNAASREAAESKPLKWLSPKSMEIKNARDVRDFLWKNMKPLTAFEAIGSPKLMELFQSVLDGEEVWITDVLEAREAIVKAKEQYGYDTWDLKIRREFTNGEGKTVRLTVGEMMSLYAYAKREQAMGHLRGGGFVLDAGATEITEKSKIRTEKVLNLTERYTMTEEDMGKLAGMLTEEQKQYATEIQDYLTSLGEKGNEISRKLYGLDLFNEKYYFPIKVKSEYLESQTGKTGDPKIKNRGMSKETVPDAQNPLVLQDFMTIVSGHVNDMATYHAFVLPVEDLTRVLNYQPSNAIIDEDGNWTEDKERKEYSTLKAVIESKYGAQANAYIEQLIRDLNGGARREAAANLIDKGITAFKRASTMASLSVLVQQPTSVFRAMAYVDPKHFRSLAALDIKGHKEAWEQVKTYAKVAAIKEMGGYDTGVGTRTADYLNSKDYKTWGERAKAFFLPDVYGGDSNYRAEIFGKGAAYADELAWIQMFDACKREQAEKLGKPMDSEEVLEAAGKRFTEVVRRTQVYDSTLTRSEYMRSKDTGMKMATAFMAEPTTVVSMMLDGLIRANRGDKAFLKKTAGAIAASVIFNALAVSLIYAARDDDEEKTYTEKYLATLATETAEGFNPLEYLPYTRDVMSLMKGYDIERTDMALFADLFKSFERITSSTRTPVEKTTEVAGAVASFFGVPIRNLVRDAMIPVNLVQSAASGERTTGKGISAAIADEFSIITNLFGADTTNAHELYEAAKSGDDAHYDRVASRYKSEQAAEMALRTALRENDKRIAEAAEAKISGELEAYESIVEQIESEGRFDRNLIIRAINNEVLEIKDNADQVVIPEEEVTDEEDETTEPLYNTSDLNDALTRGDREDFEDIYYYLLAAKQEQGKTEAQAKAAVKSGITSCWKKQYLAAWEENNTAEMKRILELLEETELYGGYNDVATMAQKWIQES